MKGTWLDLLIWNVWLALKQIPTPLFTTVISATVAWLVSLYSYRRNVRPVLVFTKRGQSTWHLENVGSGPAVNVLVSDSGKKGEWIAATRYHSIGVKDRAELFGINYADSLGAKYSDINGKWYSSICIDSETTIYRKDVLPKWEAIFTEHDLSSHRSGAIGARDVLDRSIGRIIDK